MNVVYNGDEFQNLEAKLELLPPHYTIFSSLRKMAKRIFTFVVAVC